MSLAALTWAFDQYLEPAKKVVLLALADYADDTGRCWPSQETLTKKTSLSIRTIRTHLHVLADFGLITVEERRRADGGRTSNVYVLQMTPRQILPGPPATVDRAPRQTVAAIQEPSKEPSSNLPSGEPTGKRGSRLPVGWMPSPGVAKAIRGECPDLDLTREHRKFSDHWKAAPGAKGVKADWDATWRNWMRRACDFQNERHLPSSPAHLDAQWRAFLGEVSPVDLHVRPQFCDRHPEYPLPCYRCARDEEEEE